MRILASNPDTLADLVLRQPLYAALAAAGHELLLLVRAEAAPLAAWIAPTARVLTLDHDLYSPQVARQGDALQPVFDAARAFQPDLLLVPALPWTLLAVRLAEWLPGVAIFGRRGPLAATELIAAANPEASGFSRPAETIPELRRYELLAAAILGCQVSLPEPRLAPTPVQLQAGTAALSRLGLRPHDYWAAHVGASPSTTWQSWQPESWGTVLGQWARDHGRRFLFLEASEESASIPSVQSAMGPYRIQTAALDADSLDTLVGLLHFAAGYVGGESDALHLAAALGKPVVAVFGGARWPRFVPAVEPSFAVTMGVACAGCNGSCHLAEAHCIKQVPAAELLRAIEALESGRLKTREVHVLAPDPLLSARLVREGAETAHERLLQIGQLRRELAARQQLDECRRQTEQERERSRQAAEEQFVQREIELKARLGEQLLGAQNEIHAAEARGMDLEVKLQALEREHTALIKHLEQLRRVNADLQQQVDELATSRWRKLGLKIGIAKQTSRERTTSNGN